MNMTTLETILLALLIVTTATSSTYIWCLRKQIDAFTKFVEATILDLDAHIKNQRQSDTP